MDIAVPLPFNPADPQHQGLHDDLSGSGAELETPERQQIEVAFGTMLALALPAPSPSGWQELPPQQAITAANTGMANVPRFETQSETSPDPSAESAYLRSVLETVELQVAVPAGDTEANLPAPLTTPVSLRAADPSRLDLVEANLTGATVIEPTTLLESEPTPTGTLERTPPELARLDEPQQLARPLQWEVVTDSPSAEPLRSAPLAATRSETVSQPPTSLGHLAENGVVVPGPPLEPAATATSAPHWELRRSLMESDGAAAEGAVRPAVQSIEVAALGSDNGESALMRVQASGQAYPSTGSSAATPLPLASVQVLAAPIAAPVGEAALPAADQHAAAWNQVLGQRLSQMIGQGIREAYIRLDPPEFGQLGIRVAVSGEDAAVHFTTQQGAVRDLLEANAPRLREMLAAEGLNLLDVGVDSGGRGGDENPGGKLDATGAEPQSSGVVPDSSQLPASSGQRADEGAFAVNYLA